MGTNDEPFLTTQLHEVQEDQELTIHKERDIKHEAAKTDNTHVNEDSKTEDSKTSFPRDASKTNLSWRKGSVGIHQETRKLDPRTRKDRLPANSCSQCDTIAKENAELLEARRHDLIKSNKKSGEIERRIQTLAGENEKLLASINTERERVGREQMGAKKEIRDLQAKNQKLEDELNILKGTLRGVQEKHMHTVKLLEERTADLKGAQTFLTTVDRYAGAEIMKMVEALNAEIFQGAALVSDLLGDGNAFEGDERRRHAQLSRGERDFLTQIIGPKLVEHLSTKSKQVQVDPFPLQLAVQAVLTSWCVVMVESFYPWSSREDLKEIYRRIWESEPQAVAGRWRAMMTKQAKQLDSSTQTDIAIRLLLTLLCLCGSPMANVASQQTCLHQVVSTILNMWMQLRTAIHEGVTTTEMEVIGANPNELYQDEVMSDIYADTEDVQQPDLGREKGHILCAVGMGLKRTVIRGNGDGILSIQRDIILKAKVAFPSVLFE